MINFTKIKKKLQNSDRYTLLVLIALSFLFFWPSLFGAPIFDDNVFIFQSDQFIKAPNPFVFWSRTSGFTRSWPLNYSLLWCIYQVFGDHYIAYKLINLFLHTLNAFLIIKTFRTFDAKGAFFAAFIFLIHPMQVETVSWIFQFKTIISVTFFLITFQLLIRFLYFNSKISYFISLIFFYLSLASIITAIMTPFLFAYHLFKVYTHKVVEPWLLVIPFFVLSTMVGMHTLEGVDSSAFELIAKSLYQEKQFVDYSKLREDNKPLKKAETLPAVAAKEIALPEIENKERFNFEFRDQIYFKAKIEPFSPTFYNVGTSNAAFYITNFLLPIKNSFVYPRPNYMGANNIIRVAILITLFFIFFAYSFISKGTFSKKVNYQLLFFTLTSFPILGFIYVPYMKFSMVADHWIYLSAIPLSLLTVSLFQILRRWAKTPKHKKMSKIVIIAVIGYWCLHTLTYSYIFNHRYMILERAIASNPLQSAPYLELSQRLVADKKGKEAEKFLEKAIQQKKFRNNITMLTELIHANRQTGNMGDLGENLLRLGKTYIAENNFKESKKIFLRLSNFNTGDPRNYYFLTLLKLKDEQDKEAYAFFNKLFPRKSRKRF